MFLPTDAADNNTIVVGAVAHTPDVVTLWEGLREYFRQVWVSLDFVLFQNYDRQIQSLLDHQIDIAWNSALAHVKVRSRTQDRSLSLAMRDSDRDCHTRFVLRKDAGIGSLRDLIGKQIAVGSRDSVESRLLPLFLLKQQGLPLDRINLLSFEADVGKHGQSGASEREILKAVQDGRAHVGAVGAAAWEAAQRSGAVDPGVVEARWSTPTYDRCIFDVLPDIDPGKVENFKQALFELDWNNALHKRLLELAGAKKWLDAREEGYECLFAALEQQIVPT